MGEDEYAATTERIGKEGRLGREKTLLICKIGKKRKKKKDMSGSSENSLR